MRRDVEIGCQGEIRTLCRLGEETSEAVREVTDTNCHLPRLRAALAAWDDYMQDRFSAAVENG